MQLWALHCGDLRTDVGGLVGGSVNGVIGDVPVMTFAVDTGDGVLVFDTGIHEACCGPDPAAHFGALLAMFEIRCPRHALVDERLRQAGYAPDEVRWVANSHLHFDHAGRNDAFPAATQLVRARELAYARQRMTKPSGFLSGDLTGVVDAHWDYDVSTAVTDDGRVTLLDTPGHTPGHQALQVDFADGRRFVCVGDAAYTLAAIDVAEPTGRPADHDVAVDTLVRLRDLARAGATLLTAHDLDQWRDVPDVALLHSA